MYRFPPLQNYGDPKPAWAYMDNRFTDDELKEIIKMGEALEIEQATVADHEGGRSVNMKSRDTHVAWIDSDQGWLAERLSRAIIQLNHQFFNFDLSGFWESFQYTKYDAKAGGQYYDWHIDMSGSIETPRKLSAIVLLSDPNEYSGAKLQIYNGSLITLEPKKGRIYAFPSYTVHRVTEITQGVRISLVTWVTGPAFK